MNLRPFTLFVAAWALPQALGATVYSVSPGGDDAAVGSVAAPWKTLAHAASLAQPGDTVQLRQGVYRETLSSVRAGTAAAPIVFQNYGTEKAVLAGSDLVTGTWVLDSGNVWRMEAQPTAIGLFVDGELMQPARWPNAAVGDYFGSRATADTGSNGTTLVDASLPALSLTTARIFITPGSGWVSYTRAVMGYGGGQFTFDTSIGGTNAAYYPKAGNPYLLYNDRALLDAPGEWYQDASGRIYLYVPGGGSPATHTVEIGRRKKVADINHAYIQLKGLYTFAGGILYTNASNGLVQGVHQRFVQHFTEVDGYGAENTYNGFNGGSNGVWKDGSIDGSASDGLILNGTAHAVSGMTIHNVCYIGTYRGAIRTGGKDPLITGNTLYDSGRFLVYHGGTPGGSIDHNEMYNAGLMTHDLGATYCFQTEGGGMTIAYNYVHDVTTAVGCGIYLDNGSSNFKVHHNVVENINLTGIKVNLPSYGNQVVNNTIWNCKYSIEGGGSTRPQEMSGTALVNNLINNATRVITTGSYPATLINNGSYPAIAFVGSTFHLASTSGAIDQGVVRSPYTNGYSGSAPDIGAFEYGQTPWTCGSIVPVPPFPYPSDFGRPTATPTRTRTATVSATKTRSATVTPTGTPSLTQSPTRSATATPSRSATASVTPSMSTTPTPSASASRTPSLSASASSSPTPTRSSTPPVLSATDTPTTSATSTRTPTATLSPAGTATSSETRSPTATLTATLSATETPADSATSSPTVTFSRTPSATPSLSATATPTGSATPSTAATASSTATGTRSPTASMSPTISASNTASGTLTLSATPSASATLSGSSTATATPSASWTSTAMASPTSSATATPTRSATSTPNSTATASPTPSAEQSATASPSITVTADPTADFSAGPLNILALVPYPNPNPQHWALHLEGAVDGVTLRIYSVAGTCVSVQRSGALPRGWSQLPLDEAWLAAAPNGLYFAQAVAEQGERRSQPSPRAKLLRLR